MANAAQKKLIKRAHEARQSISKIDKDAANTVSGCIKAFEKQPSCEVAADDLIDATVRAESACEINAGEFKKKKGGFISWLFS